MIVKSATTTDVAAEIRARLHSGHDPLGILAWLTGILEFRWSRDCEPQQLRGLGISATCTAGPRNLLANWCAAVDRKSATSARAVHLAGQDVSGLWQVDEPMTERELRDVICLVHAMGRGTTFSGVYRNWRGEVRSRRLDIIRFWHGSTEWHPKPGLMLTAIDLETEDQRDFHVADFDMDTLETINPKGH